MQTGSIRQSCAICKSEGKDNNKTTSKPQEPVESSPTHRKGEEEVQLAEQINWDYLAVFVLYCKMQCKTVALCSCGVMWPHDPFQNLNVCRSLTTLTVFILCKICIYPSTISVDVLVDIST